MSEANPLKKQNWLLWYIYKYIEQTLLIFGNTPKKIIIKSWKPSFGFASTWKSAVRNYSSPLASENLFDLQSLAAAVLFFSFAPVFVPLPVFIKLVKFLLQLCQPRIMLRCAHHNALQLPGNQVWRWHAKRQRTPSDGGERTSHCGGWLSMESRGMKLRSGLSKLPQLLLSAPLVCWQRTSYEWIQSQREAAVAVEKSLVGRNLLQTPLANCGGFFHSLPEISRKLCHR